MEKIKSFLSKILAIIFTITLTYFVLNTFLNKLFTYNNIYDGLSSSKIDSFELIDLNFNDEIKKHINIDSYIYDYITNEALFLSGKLDKEPVINRDNINKEIKSGIDEYLELDKENKSKMIDEINKRYKVDYENGQFVFREDIDKINNTIKEKYKDNNIIDIAKFMMNDDYKVKSMIAFIAALLLIAIVNFNIIFIFLYTIVPFIIEIILQIVLLLVSKNLNFVGNDLADLLNYFMKIIGNLTYNYILIFSVLLLISIIMYFITKNLNIIKSHKKGVATLDTIFDDYDKE